MSKISVSCEVKKNTGNFENITFNAGIEVSVEDPYNQEEWDKAWDKVDEELSAKLKELS